MWVTGSSPPLGSWDKHRAVPMARNSRGDWQLSFPHPDPDQPVLYKYLLLNSGRAVVWTSPKTRVFPNSHSVMDSRARPPQTRVVDAIAADELSY